MKLERNDGEWFGAQGVHVLCMKDSISSGVPERESPSMGNQ